MLIRGFSDRPATGCVSVAAHTKADAVRICELMLVGALHGDACAFAGNRMAARAAAKPIILFRLSLACVMLRFHELLNDRAGEALEASHQRRYHRHRGCPWTTALDETAAVNRAPLQANVLRITHLAARLPSPGAPRGGDALTPARRERDSFIGIIGHGNQGRKPSVLPGSAEDPH